MYSCIYCIIKKEKQKERKKEDTYKIEKHIKMGIWVSWQFPGIISPLWA